MTRPSYLLWFALIILVLLPTAAGRFLLDLAGGLLLVLFALPLLVTGFGWLGWRFLQSRMVQCDTCGASVIKDSLQCPICGSNLSKEDKASSIPASSATIDITAKDAD